MFLRLLLVLSAAALASQAQPTVGLIDFYGLRKTSPERLQKELGLRLGGPLPAAKSLLEDKLEAINGIVASHIEAACCVSGQAILYIGIEEKGAPHFELHPPVAGSAVPLLPGEIRDTYRALLEALATASRNGFTAEDWTRGHSLITDGPSRLLQLKLIELAEPNRELLERALAEGDEEERAMAAYVIGYVKKKPLVVNRLQAALRDSEAAVRANALRSLAAFSKLAQVDRESEIKVEPTWMVEMLHSIVWSDRQNTVRILLNLTEARDEKLLALLRERSVESLAEMARWKHLPHALPHFLLLGRASEWKEDEIQAAWSENREAAIERMLKAIKKKNEPPR